MNSILIIDDSVVERIYMEGIAGRLSDTEVTLAPDYDEALKLCEDNRYDLILVDVIVPFGEAGNIAKRLKGCGDNYDTAVIAMGHKEDFAQEYSPDQCGFDNYIEKPVEFSMLRAAVSMYAGGAGR